MSCVRRPAGKHFLLAAVGALALAPCAVAQTAGNPWDYGDEAGQQALPGNAAPSAVRQHPARSWTEMGYPELLQEVERDDGTYSPYTKQQMRNRLQALEALNQPVAEPEIEADGQGNVPPPPEATGAASGGAVPVLLVPAAQPQQAMVPTTPWWKLPKDQQAAAKAAQEKQRRQRAGVASPAADGTGAAQEEKKETSRDRIYRQIQKNRGY